MMFLCLKNIEGEPVYFRPQLLGAVLQPLDDSKGSIVVLLNGYNFGMVAKPADVMKSVAEQMLLKGVATGLPQLKGIENDTDPEDTSVLGNGFLD